MREYANYREVLAREVNYRELARVWQRLRTGLDIKFWDRRYWVADAKAIRMIVEETHVERRKYRTDRMDCDNFAIRFMSEANKYGINTVGLVHDKSSRHCYNAIFCDRDGTLVAMLFEPQTDRFVAPGEDDLHQAKKGEVTLA